MAGSLHARKIGVAVVVLASIGCHHGKAADPTQSPDAAVAAPPGLVVALDHLWQLEASGNRPNDTTVVFPARTGRTVILRQGAPDSAIYAIVEFPADTQAREAGDSMHVTLRPTAGRFALTLTTPDQLGPGVHATFSYAKHFQAPGGVTGRYGSTGRFEEALVAARRVGESQAAFLVSTRPAADMIRFALPEPGTYLLVAPR